MVGWFSGDPGITRSAGVSVPLEAGSILGLVKPRWTLIGEASLGQGHRVRERNVWVALWVRVHGQPRLSRLNGVGAGGKDDGDASDAVSEEDGEGGVNGWR